MNSKFQILDLKKEMIYYYHDISEINEEIYLDTSFLYRDIEINKNYLKL